MEDLNSTLVYTYNADGLRVQELWSGDMGRGEKAFTWDLASPLAQVLATSDGAAYVHGLDLVAERRSGVWAYPLGDALGSVRQWTDEDGYVDYAGGYTPFGTEMWREGSTSSNWGYTGEWWDSRAGLLYLRARWYEVEVGRFAQVDPWEGDRRRPISLQPYLYASDDPINRVDPTGRYGDEVHYALTRRWALETTGPLLGGAGEYLAELIARGNRSMDFGPVVARQDLHFVDWETASGNAYRAIGLGHPYVFGATLHQAQDYFSHYDEGYRFPGGIGHISDNVGTRPPEQVEGFYAIHPRHLVQTRLSALYPGVDFSKEPTGIENRRPPFTDNELTDLYLREWGTGGDRAVFGYNTDHYFSHTYRDQQMEWKTRLFVSYLAVGILRDPCPLIEVLARQYGEDHMAVVSFFTGPVPPLLPLP